MFSHLSPLTLEVVGAPQMTLQQYLSILPCLPLPSGNLQTPFLSILWCYLPISSSVFFSFLLLSLSLAVGWLCWGLTSQSTIFQSCRDGAIASWVINQYFRGVKCLAQGHNTVAVGLEPRTSRSGVRHSTTEPPRSPLSLAELSSPYQRILRCGHTIWVSVSLP